MKGKIKVKFWLDDDALFLKNPKTEQVKTIEDEKQIAWFLNAHNMTVHDVKGVMEGYDVMNLFLESRMFHLLFRSPIKK